MRLRFESSYRSLVEPPSHDDLPPLTLVSGLNGAGKTQLLEALSQGHLRVDSISSSDIRLIPRGALTFGDPAVMSFGELKSVWRRVADDVIQISNFLDRTSPDYRKAFHSRLSDERHGYHIPDDDRKHIEQASGKAFDQLFPEDLDAIAPFYGTIHDVFASRVSDVVLPWERARDENQYSRYRKAEGLSCTPHPLTDEEFEKEFGRSPALQFNELLERAGLPYKLRTPPTDRDARYDPLLEQTGQRPVRFTDLSTGEHTILALVLQLVAMRVGDHARRLPELLLLDEPDSTLHPAAVDRLFDLLRALYDDYGISVIVTTHSPTTVAIAPETSLFIMRRFASPRLTKAGDRDEALSRLTVGLSTLSVRLENRRQVFVESENDEECYQELFRIVRPSLDGAISLAFIASGKGGQGNSHAVMHLVSSLRDQGNTTVFGIVDRDDRDAAPPGILFLPKRYSLENWVFDPLVLGAFLLRERIRLPAELGLPSGIAHFSLGAPTAQPIVDAVCTAVGLGDATPAITIDYEGGFQASVPISWLDIRGHDLEAHIVDTWPGLKRFQKKLKAAVIRNLLLDVPALVPSDVVDLMRSIANPA